MPQVWVIQIKKRRLSGDRYYTYFRKMRESGGISGPLTEAAQYEEERIANHVRRFLVNGKAFPDEYEFKVVELSQIKTRKGDKEIALCK